MDFNDVTGDNRQIPNPENKNFIIEKSLNFATNSKYCQIFARTSEFWKFMIFIVADTEFFCNL